MHEHMWHRDGGGCKSPVVQWQAVQIHEALADYLLTFVEQEPSQHGLQVLAY